MAQHSTLYKLRNQPLRSFTISLRLQEESAEKVAIAAHIKDQVHGNTFDYRVEFSSDFIASKTNFDGEMYLHTALSVVQSQIESLQHRDTLLSVHRGSGLIETSPLSLP